jgi:hypothetical protein
MPVWLRKILERCLTIEHVGEHIGNQRKMKRNPPPAPPPLLPKFKRKKSKAPWVHAWAFHWLNEISIPKRVRHHFWPGLLTKKHTHTIAKNSLPTHCGYLSCYY